MNTPRPCDQCERLGYDCLNDWAPVYCKLGFPKGNMKCKYFRHWETGKKKYKEPREDFPDFL